MKDENNVIETKTEKENKMSDTTKEIEKESNVILSKLSEEQFNKLRKQLMSGVGSFYFPNLNGDLTELLTIVKEIFNREQEYRFSDSLDVTEDEFISIVKDYGSVSHALVVDGEMLLPDMDLSESLIFDISAEKIEEIENSKFPEINSRSFSEVSGLHKVEDYLKSHSIMGEGSLKGKLTNEYSSKDYINYHNAHVTGLHLITRVKGILPKREELLPEKLVA